MQVIPRNLWSQEVNKFLTLETFLLFFLCRQKLFLLRPRLLQWRSLLQTLRHPNWNQRIKPALSSRKLRLRKTTDTFYIETIRTLNTSPVLLLSDELLEPAVSEGIFRQACNSHSENTGKNKLVYPKISMKVFVVWPMGKEVFLSTSKIWSNSTVSKRSKTRHHSTFNSGLTAYSIVSSNRNTPEGKHNMTLKNLGPKPTKTTQCHPRTCLKSKHTEQSTVPRTEAM